MKISHRTILGCVGLAVAAITLFGILSYWTGRSLLLDEVNSKLDTVANSQRAKIEEVIIAWRDRASLVASRTQMRISLANYLETGDEGELKRVARILKDARKSTDAVEMIRVQTPDNPDILTVGALSHEIRASLPVTGHGAGTAIKAFHRDGNAQLLVDVEMPLDLKGAFEASLRLTLRAGELLQATRDYTGLGLSGETMLLGYRADGVPVHITSLRHRPESTLEPLEDAGQNRELARDALAGHEEINADITDYRSIPVTAATRYLDSLDWGIVVKIDRGEILAPITRFGRNLALTALALTLLSLLTGYLISRPLSKPLEDLSQVAQRIRNGERGVRANIDASHTREVQELSDSFNCLAESLLHANDSLEQRVKDRTRALEDLNETLEQRVEERTIALKMANEQLTGALVNLQDTQKELVESEKMAALGRMIAGIAHEINTPLGISVTGASHLQEEIDSVTKKTAQNALTRSDLQKFLETSERSCSLMLDHLDRAACLISDFKQIAVDQSNPDIRQLKLTEYLEKVVATLRPKFKHSPHSITISADPDLTIVTCPGALSQALTALITNCLTHAFEGEGKAGHITLKAEQAGNGHIILLKDDGCGIAPENMDRIFDPFFTTKRGSGGSGLGLSLVYNIVTDLLKGRIECESNPGEGSCFTLTLPDLEEAPALEIASD